MRQNNNINMAMTEGQFLSHNTHDNIYFLYAQSVINSKCYLNNRKKK